MSSRLRAAIWAAIDAMEEGATWLAVDMLLAAVEDEEEEEQLGTANPNPYGRPANGWPGERAWGR